MSSDKARRTIHTRSGPITIEEGADIFMLPIDAKSVRAPEIGPAADVLMQLSDCAELSDILAGTLMLDFEGWDEDPRELPEIPEVRAFMKLLHAQWPYWVNFILPEPTTIALLYGLLLPNPKFVHTPDGRFNLVMDDKEVMALTQQLLHAAQALHEVHGFSDLRKEQIRSGFLLATSTMFDGG